MYVHFNFSGIHIISRQEWNAREPRNVTPIKFHYLPVPLPYVVIHHSAVNTGCKGEECVKAVRNYQNYHMDNLKWDDIGYNFIVKFNHRTHFKKHTRT